MTSLPCECTGVSTVHEYIRRKTRDMPPRLLLLGDGDPSFPEICTWLNDTKEKPRPFLLLSSLSLVKFSARSEKLFLGPEELFYCTWLGVILLYTQEKRTDHPIKGTVSRDILFLVFFMNQFPPSSWLFNWGCFKFFWKFADIFTAQGLPPVSLTPVANGKILIILVGYLLVVELTYI